MSQAFPQQGRRTDNSQGELQIANCKLPIEQREPRTQTSRDPAVSSICNLPFDRASTLSSAEALRVLSEVEAQFCNLQSRLFIPIWSSPAAEGACSDGGTGL
jgi:hypothetical protein